MDRPARRDLLEKVQFDAEAQSLLYEKCRRDIVFWINTFGWTYDPRLIKSGRSPEIPFILYPFQEWAVKEWQACILAQEDFLVEKSRDMGATWLLAMVIVHFFIFAQGTHFHIGSRNEDEVDTGHSDPGATIFGKLRFALDMLPRWMRPVYKSRKLSLENPTKNNFITGEAAVQNFGRGKRATALLFDELAFWPWAEQAWGGAADVTGCRIAISTPNGPRNKYAQLANDSSNIVLEPPKV